MPRRLLYRFPHFIVTIQIKNVRHEVQSILIILNFGIEASKVKTIRKVVLVNLAEIFVASRGNKLLGNMLVN